MRTTMQNVILNLNTITPIINNPWLIGGGGEPCVLVAEQRGGSCPQRLAYAAAGSQGTCYPSCRRIKQHVHSPHVLGPLGGTKRATS